MMLGHSVLIGYFFICGLCAWYASAQECDLPFMDDVDYSDLKNACVEEDVCTECLTTLIDTIMMTAPDESLVKVIPKIYNVETELFDPNAIRVCATPYIPALVQNQVFVPLTKAVRILECEDSSVKDILEKSLAERDLEYLLKPEGYPSESAENGEAAVDEEDGDVEEEDDVDADGEETEDAQNGDDVNVEKGVVQDEPGVESGNLTATVEAGNLIATTEAGNLTDSVEAEVVEAGDLTVSVDAGNQVENGDHVEENGGAEQLVLNGGDGDTAEP